MYAGLLLVGVARDAAAQTSPAPVYVATATFSVGVDVPNGQPYPNAATFDSMGRLIVTNPGQNRVEVYDGATPALIAHYGTADLSACNLYDSRPPIATDFANPADFVSTIDDIIPVLPPHSSIGPCLSSPQSVAVDTDDRIYVADTNNYRILVFKSADPANLGADGSLQLQYAFGSFGGWVMDPGPLILNPRAFSIST